ncbi:hypothetical protein, partial [Geodermatophilus obscurus]|uniref:hypothetical protein n=1 Tax=Geodermatophilus obscurus TaxID=1861 RepID=UPI001AD90255
MGDLLGAIGLAGTGQRPRHAGKPPGLPGGIGDRAAATRPASAATRPARSTWPAAASAPATPVSTQACRSA